MPLRLTVFIFAVFIFAAACVGTNPTNLATNNTAATTPAATPQPAATVLDDRAAGAKLWAENCVACHKEDGTGGRVEIEGERLNVEDLTEDKIKKFTDERIAGYIANGVVDEGMPAFKDKLSDQQIRQLVTFIRSDIQKMPASSPASPAR